MLFNALFLIQSINALDFSKVFYVHPAVNRDSSLSLGGSKVSLNGNRGKVKFSLEDTNDGGLLSIDNRVLCINEIDDLEPCGGSMQKFRIKEKMNGFRIKTETRKQLAKFLFEKCLTVEGLEVKMEKCQDNNISQIFFFEEANENVSNGNSNGFNNNNVNTSGNSNGNTNGFNNNGTSGSTYSNGNNGTSGNNGFNPCSGTQCAKPCIGPHCNTFHPPFPQLPNVPTLPALPNLLPCNGNQRKVCSTNPNAKMVTCVQLNQNENVIFPFPPHPASCALPQFAQPAGQPTFNPKPVQFVPYPEPVLVPNNIFVPVSSKPAVVPDESTFVNQLSNIACSLDSNTPGACECSRTGGCQI